MRLIFLLISVLLSSCDEPPFHQDAKEAVIHHLGKPTGVVFEEFVKREGETDTEEVLAFCGLVSADNIAIPSPFAVAYRFRVEGEHLITVHEVWVEAMDIDKGFAAKWEFYCA